MKNFLPLLLLFSLLHLSGQNKLDYESELNKLEQELDSLLIYNLIEDLLSTESLITSDIYARVGYSSNVLSAGRTYGIDQYGLSPGISFYHKKGWFTDISGYWNSEYDPKYNLTVFTAGYMGFMKKQWSYSINYEYWLYNKSKEALPSTYSLTNSLSSSISYNIGPFSAGLDYSYLFGKKRAQRIIGSVSGNIKLQKTWIFDRISIYPSAYIIAGHDEITSLRITDDPRINRLYFLANLSKSDLDSLNNAYPVPPDSDRRRKRINNIASNITEEQYDQLLDQYYIQENNRVFGILNYSFGLPVSLSLKNFNMLISYNYSIPVKLSGEEYKLKPVGFLSASLSFRIPVSK